LEKKKSQFLEDSESENRRRKDLRIFRQKKYSFEERVYFARNTASTRISAQTDRNVRIPLKELPSVQSADEEVSVFEQRFRVQGRFIEYGPFSSF